LESIEENIISGADVAAGIAITYKRKSAEHVVMVEAPRCTRCPGNGNL